jgi:hypothetical protein
MFADGNPMAKYFATLAEQITANRKPASPNNPFLGMQKHISEQITAGLEAFQNVRDSMVEQVFFGVYGSPMYQALLGVRAEDKVRELPATTPEELTARKTLREAYAAKVSTGGLEEALARAVLYVVAADRALDERCAIALGATYRQQTQLSFDAFKAMLREQFYILLLEGERAIDALTKLVPDGDNQTAMLQRVRDIVGAAGPTPRESERLVRLQTLFPQQPSKGPAGGPPAGPSPRPARQPAAPEAQDKSTRH